MQSLLCDPNPNSPANSEAARMFSENKREYNRKVREVVEQSWTADWCTMHPTIPTLAQLGTLCTWKTDELYVTVSLLHVLTCVYACMSNMNRSCLLFLALIDCLSIVFLWAFSNFRLLPCFFSSFSFFCLCFHWSSFLIFSEMLSCFGKEIMNSSI